MATTIAPPSEPLVDHEEEDLLPAPQIDLRRAVKLGLIGGVASTFVSAIGMVEDFNDRDVIDNLTLGTALLVAIPFLIGFTAGSPPQQLAGVAPTKPSWKNPVAGVLAGLGNSLVMTLFIAIIVNFDIREYFLNITPALASDPEGPRLLLFGRDYGPGIAMIFVVYTLAAAAGGALFLLDGRWRRAIIAGLIWVTSFALLETFVQQLLEGVQEELNILTEGVIDFLYESDVLTIPAVILLFALGSGLYLYRQRPDRKPLRPRVERKAREWHPVVQVAASVVALIISILIVQAVPHILGTFLSEVFAIAGIYALMALGLNIVVGYAGMLDLGYVAFFAVGAYATGILSSETTGLQWGWTFWETLPVVVVASALAGLVVGTPVLRMRGDYLAIVTLGFGEISQKLFLSDWLEPTFGGAQGIKQIPNIKLDLGFWDFEVDGPEAFLYVIFGLILLAAYVSWAMQNSRIGRAWMAMREDESVAEAVGVNIVTAKLSAFVVGAILAGLGGAFFATKIGSIFPNLFDINVSIVVLVVVIVGGMASVRGVILGAVVLLALPELLREFDDYRLLIYGALLIFMMLRRPEGFIPSRRRAMELHEGDVAQDAWLRAQAQPAGNGG